MKVRLTVLGPDLEQDVEIMTTRDLTAADFVAQLSRHLQTELPADITVQGRPLPGSTLIGSALLRSGSIMSLGPGGHRPRRRNSALQLRVTSGPDAGHSISLTRGEHVVGRDLQTDLSIADREISRRHACVTVTATGVTIRDLSSTNGTRLGEQVVGPANVAVDAGSLIRIGRSWLSVGGGDEPPAAIQIDRESVLINRPPRFSSSSPPAVVEFPSLGPARSLARAQWLTTLLPAGFAVALAMSMHSMQFLAFALLSPVAQLASWLTDHRLLRRDRRSDRARYAVAERAAAATLSVELARETALRRRTHPDAAAVASTAATPDCRLWERQPTDDTFLSFRIASADQTARVTVSGRADAVAAPIISQVPVVVSLLDGPLGVAGPASYARGLMRWLVGQLLTLHSRTDVSLVALLGDDTADWQWLRWVPVTVAHTAEQRRHRVEELVDVLAHRSTTHRDPRDPWAGPWLVLLIDPLTECSELSGLASLLEDGPRFGITAICVSSDVRGLPKSCRSLAHFDSADGYLVNIVDAAGTAITGAASERVSGDWAEQLSRDLAPLRDLRPSAQLAIPRAVALSDLVPPIELTIARLRARWIAHSKSSRAEPSAVLGVDSNGTFEIDLVRDGPHALIAGSTGSGKSELLRALVAGLAFNNSPDQLGFVLIDYKGGAAFAECAQLPHTMAVVTDLDTHLIQRALTSLEAELRRREAAFAAVGATDLDTYRATDPGPVVPIARLVLIVDEFAALAEELPEFIAGLVGIAQRGRSLGVHLVLATQRPNGVVSAEIKANMSLRIALRVTDAGESIDVLGTAAAATISKSTPGRAFALTANGLKEFQTARVGQPVSTETETRIVALDQWHQPVTVDDSLAGAPNDLDLLIAAAEQIHRDSGLSPSAPPWLPPLDTSILTDQLGPTNDPCVLRFGLLDDPSHQQQIPVTHDLARGGSLAFIGNSRSGRTSALRTLAGLAARQLTPEQLQLYVLDCADGSLDSLELLSCCGTVATADDPVVVARLIQRLSDELDARHRARAEVARGQSGQQFGSATSMPVVLILLDGWEGFSALSVEHDGGRSMDLLLRIMREGASAGYTVALAGDRAMLSVRTASAIEHKFLLALTDRSDYAIAGIRTRDLPAHFPPGRAISADGGLELQLAMLPDADSAAGQWTECVGAASAPAEAATLDRDSSLGPTRPVIRVRPLPQRVSLSELSVDPVPAGGTTSPILLGVAGDEAVPFVVDLFDQDRRFIVGGPSRSGRSTAALVIARQAHELGRGVIVGGNPDGALARWASGSGLRVLGPVARDADWIRESDLLVLDDAELFADTEAGAAIEDLIATGTPSVVACLRSEDLMVSFRGIGALMRRHRTGLVLHPSPADTDSFGITVSLRRGRFIPGRGMLMTERVRSTMPTGLPIQVAWPE